MKFVFLIMLIIAATTTGCKSRQQGASLSAGEVPGPPAADLDDRSRAHAFSGKQPLILSICDSRRTSCQQAFYELTKVTAHAKNILVYQLDLGNIRANNVKMRNYFSPYQSTSIATYFYYFGETSPKPIRRFAKGEEILSHAGIQLTDTTQTEFVQFVNSSDQQNSTPAVKTLKGAKSDILKRTSASASMVILGTYWDSSARCRSSECQQITSLLSELQETAGQKAQAFKTNLRDNGFAEYLFTSSGEEALNINPEGYQVPWITIMEANSLKILWQGPAPNDLTELKNLISLL